MFIVTLFALVGAIFGNIQGALLGGIIGYFVTKAVKRSVIGSLHVAQAKLIDSTFAIMGALCKADSVITRDELNVVEKIFRMLNLSGEQRQQAKKAFNYGKQAAFDLDSAVDQFAQLSRGRGPLLQLFLQLQCMAVAADGQVHPAEHAMLVRIARRLGLRETDVSQLEALLRASTSGQSRSAAAAPDSRLADAYTALGITRDATGAEVKRAYRKLISKNHPDKLASRGLPDSMRPVAEERSRVINSAYDLIKESRSDVK